MHTHVNILLFMYHTHIHKYFTSYFLRQDLSPNLWLLCVTLYRVLGSKFRPSCLQSRYFISGVICPDHIYILKMLVFKLRAPHRLGHYTACPRFNCCFMLKLPMCCSYSILKFHDRFLEICLFFYSYLFMYFLIYPIKYLALWNHGSLLYLSNVEFAFLNLFYLLSRRPRPPCGQPDWISLLSKLGFVACLNSYCYYSKYLVCER